MTSDKPPPSELERASRRRPPPVISLEATEVKSSPAAAEPRADAPPQHEPPRDRRPFTWLPEELSWAQVFAGIAGASGGLLVMLLLWLVGALSSVSNTSSDLGPRLALLEMQLKDLVKESATRPVPASVDPKAIDEATARLAKLEAGQARLETAQAAPRPPASDSFVLGRLSATEDAAKSLADNVAAMSRRYQNIDAALRDAINRIDNLTAALAEMQTATRNAAGGSDRAVRLAVAAAALRTAVERGDPFTSELAIVKPFTSDANVLAPLEPFAATGMIGNAALAGELAVIIRPMLVAADEAARDGGFLVRLQANAEKLVRIRPSDGERGDNQGAVLARITQRAERADVSGVLGELAKLPPAARAPMQGWAAKAEARDKAIEVSRRFAADAMAALKTTP